MLQLLEAAAGTFVKAYARVQRGMNERRKRLQVVERVSNPAAAAAKRQAKSRQKGNNNRRRVQAIRQHDRR